MNDECEMIDRLLRILNGGGVLTEGRVADDLKAAVAALLVEAARMDDTFEEAERRKIEDLLAERFSLTGEAARRLVLNSDSAANKTTQLFPFTSLAVKRLDEDERIRVIEMLWDVAYADGVLDPQEDMLVRRIAGLIHVPDRARGEARLRALARKGKTG